MINKNSIRKIREEIGLSQQALADKVGSTQVTISRYETGAEPCSYTFIKKVAEATGKNIYIIVTPSGESFVRLVAL